LDHLEKTLESNYISDAEHLEMFGLGDGAIGAAVKFIEYLEAAGPDWKKAFLARRREAYRARRTLGTPNPAGQNRLVPGQPIENNPRNPNKPENSTRNANVNENENKNPHQNAYQNPNPNKNENGNENENRNENGNPNQNANPNENYNANENQNVNPNGHPEP